MKFDLHHKVIISSLTEEQAPMVALFLQDEIVRHEKCEKEAKFLACMLPTISEIYESAIIRHEADIVGTNRTLAKVRKRFNL